MYYLSTDPVPAITFAGINLPLSSLTESNLNERLLAAPARYGTEKPFELLFITHHPQGKNSELIFLQASPEHNTYLKADVPRELIGHHRLHRHEYYELMFVIEGEAYQNIEHKRHFYPEGSCCLMNLNVIHQEEYASYQRLVFLSLSREYLEMLLRRPRYFRTENTSAMSALRSFAGDSHLPAAAKEKKYVDFIPLKEEEWMRTNVHHFFESLLTEMQSPTAGSSLRIDGMILQLFETLFDENVFRNTPVAIGSRSEQTLFDEVTEYLKEHHGRFFRDGIAEALHYSSDYIYKTVRKYTGLSLFDYGMTFCMEEAAALLTTTNLSVEEIMSRLAFTNQTHFYRLFQEQFGTTPSRYRSSK